MAQLLENVDYLSREIGARPAGTEEEQQAALYIAEQFQKETGFHTEIEEFTSSSNIEGAVAILGIVVIIASILAMLFNMLAIPAFLLILVAAAIYILEAFDHPFVSKALSRGASQNVVAKYQPSSDGSSTGRPRSRKIVLVAHYDSGKVKPGLVKRFESMNAPIGLICVGGMAAAAFLMLLRIFFGTAGGIGIIILNVLTVISLIIVALPVVKALLYRLAPYNEGANNNATGVAALIDVASKISQGSISEADLAQISEEITMHGEEALLESGLIPEGVELDYQDLQAAAASSVTDMEEFEEFDEEERLLAAKAAIAALTGRPVENRVYGTPAREEVDSRFEEPFAGSAPVAQNAYIDSKREAPAYDDSPSAMVPDEVDVVEEDVSGFQNAPSWFVAAQKNAKKTPASEAKVQRSRYSSALDDAERNVEERERQRQEAERAKREEEIRRQEAERALREEELAKAAARAEAHAAAVAQAEAAEDADEAPAAQEPSLDREEETSDQAEPAPEAAAPAEAAQPDAEPVAAQAAVVDLGSTIAFDPRMLEEGLAATDDAQDEPAEEEDDPSQEQDKASNAALMANLPSVDEPAPSTDLHNDNPSRSGMFRKLRTDIPSLSGAIDMPQTAPVAATPAAPSAQHAAQVPAVEPQQAEAVDYDMELPVSDDLAASHRESASGPARGAQQIEMPSSRANGMMERFRNSGADDLAESPQEWLDVDDDFDARDVGRKRGGWESFRNESGTVDHGDWEGGAFSRIRLGHVSTLSGEETDSGISEELIEAAEDRELNDEIEQIIHFRNPSFNTEVWFVAIGSDTDLHDGAKAFVEEHRAELRGSMIIELESLGAGILSVASEEGRFRSTKASSRIKRFTRGATEATGIALDHVRLSGTDSIASVLQREGFQSMHLFGAEDGAIALKGSADDVIENVDDMILEENVGFIIELLKHV